MRRFPMFCMGLALLLGLAGCETDRPKAVTTTVKATKTGKKGALITSAPEPQINPRFTMSVGTKMTK